MGPPQIQPAPARSLPKHMLMPSIELPEIAFRYLICDGYGDAAVEVLSLDGNDLGLVDGAV